MDNSSVYQPDEDTYLLEDALTRHQYLPAKVIVEVGCGSGYISALLRRIYPLAYIISTDINPHAAEQAHALLSGSKNGDVIRGFLSDTIRRADVAVFNPPYLPSEREPKYGEWADWSWAGGLLGAEIIFSFLETTMDIPIRYIVVCTFNPLSEIMERLRKTHTVSVIATRKVMSETLLVLYIERIP